MTGHFQKRRKPVETVRICPCCGNYTLRYVGKRGDRTSDGRDILIYACERSDCKYVENCPED